MKYLPLILILGISLIFLIVQCIKWNSEYKDGSYGIGMACGFSIAVLFVLEMACICKSIYDQHPKAIDVYQGKTTIEYTIRDGVKVDSVIVFKKELN